MRLPTIKLAPKAFVAPAVHAAAALVLSAAIAAGGPGAALADGSPRVVGEVQGSGLVFKDTLRVEAFGDPKVMALLAACVLPTRAADLA